jgi:hypothetical protein
MTPTLRLRYDAEMRTVRSWFSPDRLLLGLIVLYGALLRIKGFTRRDLWFDDAWVMAPAHVAFGTAIHLVNTTPLFSLCMWAWDHLYPHHTEFLQVPIYCSSLVAIVAVFWMLRHFELWRPLPFLGALVIATAPIVTMYSTHIKQYNFDMIFASVLLVLADRWRRDPKPRTMYTIGAVSAFALLFSGATYVVVVPLFLVAAHQALLEPSRRRVVFLTGAGVAVVFALDYLVWLRHLAHGMIIGWTTRGYLFDYTSWHSRAFSIQTMGTQFLHYLLALGTGHRPDPSHRVTNLGLAIATLFFLALGALVAQWLWPLLRHPRRPLGRGATAALTMVLAVAMAVARHDPFGGGRTDEVLYPAFLLLVLLFLHHGVTRWPQTAVIRTALAGCALAAVSLAWMGADHRTDYPGNALRVVVTKLFALKQPGDAVVVDPWMSFTWMADGLPDAMIDQRPSFIPWSQGFHITGTGNNVIFSENYFTPGWAFPYISKYTKRVWYVTERSGRAWPSATNGDPLIPSRTYTWFLQNGWVCTKQAIWGPHTAAVLLEYHGTTAAH